MDKVLEAKGSDTCAGCVHNWRDYYCELWNDGISCDSKACRPKARAVMERDLAERRVWWIIQSAAQEGRGEAEALDNLRTWRDANPWAQIAADKLREIVGATFAPQK